MGFLMRAGVLPIVLLALAASGCYSSITFDTPPRFTERDWAQHGGSALRAHRVDGHLTPPLYLCWEEPTSGAPGAAEPLLCDGNVFLTSTVGGLDVLDIRSGEASGDVPMKAVMHGTPAATGAFLLFPFAHDDPSLVCIDASTKRVYWQKDFAAIDAPLLICNGRVIAATLSGEVHSIRVRDSLELWHAELPRAVYAAPAAMDSTVFVACADGDLYALSEMSGARRWRVPSGAPVMASPACIGGGIVFANRKGDVICVNASDGAVRWKCRVDAPVYGGIAADDATVYVPVSDGTIRAFDVKDGAARWTFHCKGIPGSAPLVVGASLAVVSMSGTVSILDASNGRELWSVDTGSRIKTTPVFANGMLLVCLEDRSVRAYGSLPCP
jgi:outer membrane protein assembly factor BamB